MLVKNRQTNNNNPRTNKHFFMRFFQAFHSQLPKWPNKMIFICLAFYNETKKERKPMTGSNGGKIKRSKTF